MKNRIWLLVVTVSLLAALAYAGNFRYGNVSVTTVTAVLIGNKTGRADLSICNTDASNPIYCGDSAVTSASGMPVKAGLCSSIFGTPVSGPTTSNKDVYCVATGGSVDTRFWENTQ